MTKPHELLGGDKSHGVFPTKEAAQSFAVICDRVLGHELFWDDGASEAVGYRSDGAAEWRVTPVSSRAVAE